MALSSMQTAAGALVVRLSRATETSRSAARVSQRTPSATSRTATSPSVTSSAAEANGMISSESADLPRSGLSNAAESQDHELLQQYQQGDEKGYVELYVRRQAEVYTFCLRLAAGDRDLASDVFQDVWLKVYRKAHTFREGTNVLGWLYTIARTTFLNTRRQKPHIGLDERHQNIASTDRSLHPEYHNEQQTLKHRVEEAIAQLPLEIREPFILREFDGFSYIEIAEQLSITHGAVRQRIYRAKQAMRTMLADLVEADPGDDPAPEWKQSSTVRSGARGGQQ